MTLRERLTASVTDIRARGQRLVQLNLELLTSELKAKGRKFGAAIGLFAAAGLLALYAIAFALATIAVLLALVLPLWAAMLIVTAALFALVAILVLVGRDQVRKIGDPQPTAAIAEAKVTADLVKANARGTAAGVRARLRPRPAAPTGGGQAPVAAPAGGARRRRRTRRRRRDAAGLPRRTPRRHPTRERRTHERHAVSRCERLRRGRRRRSRQGAGASRRPRSAPTSSGSAPGWTARSPRCAATWTRRSTPASSAPPGRAARRSWSCRPPPRRWSRPSSCAVADAPGG